MTKQKIRLIIFDVGGVLIFYNHMIAAKKMVKEINVPAEKIYKTISVSGNKSKFMKSCELGDSSRVYWNIAAKELGIKKINTKRFNEFWRTMFWKNKSIFKLIQKLKKKYKLAILSNTCHDHKNNIFKRKYKLNKVFRFSVFSCDVKQRKPEAKIFKTMLKKLKTKPKETIFIDDMKKNIAGAKKLGIKTILFKNNKQLIKDLNKLEIEV